MYYIATEQVVFFFVLNDLIYIYIYLMPLLVPKYAKRPLGKSQCCGHFAPSRIVFICIYIYIQDATKALLNFRQEMCENIKKSRRLKCCLEEKKRKENPQNTLKFWIFGTFITLDAYTVLYFFLSRTRMFFEHILLKTYEVYAYNTFFL